MNVYMVMMRGTGVPLVEEIKFTLEKLKTPTIHLCIIEAFFNFKGLALGLLHLSTLSFS